MSHNVVSYVSPEDNDRTRQMLIKNDRRFADIPCCATCLYYEGTFTIKAINDTSDAPLGTELSLMGRCSLLPSPGSMLVEDDSIAECSHCNFLQVCNEYVSRNSMT